MLKPAFGISKSPFKGGVCVCVPVVVPHVSQLRPEVAVAAPVMEPEVPVVPTVLSLCVGVCKKCVCVSVCSIPATDGFISAFFF